MKRMMKAGAAALGVLVLLAGCSQKAPKPEETKAQETEAASSQESFLGDAVVEEDGTLTQLGEAEEGWEASRDQALKEAESSGNKGPGERFDRSMEEEIIRLVNEERARKGLSQLKMDEVMMTAAETRAKEQKTSFSHTRPDGSDAFTVFAQFEIPANYRGENLACGGICGADMVMRMWIESSGHYANIINDRFSRIGVGYFESGNFGYWCQLFAN